MNINKLSSEDFVPVNSNVLVQPGPIKKIKTEVIVKKKVTEFKKGKPQKSAYPEGEVAIERQPTSMRVGTILAIDELASARTGLQKGDIIVYNTLHRNVQLDLLAKKSNDDKCPIMLMAHEIFAKINDIENNESE